MNRVVYVNIEHLDGNVEKLKKMPGGKTTVLGKDFKDYCGEHESIVFIKTGVGFRKISELGDDVKYICLRAV